MNGITLTLQTTNMLDNTDTHYLPTLATCESLSASACATANVAADAAMAARCWFSTKTVGV
jgi:hypothetical protein